MSEMTVGASYDTDWHIYLDDPEHGPLGWCIGVGPDEDFDPEAATRVLALDGYTVTSPWTEQEAGDYQFTAQARREGA